MKRALLVCGLSAVIASSLTLVPSPSSAKTVKACVEEWKANKSTIQASGKKKTDFITECRAETASTEPAPAPTPQPTQAEKQKSTATAAPEKTAAVKHKTIKACAAEWTENKATIQASGKTRKDFIAECRTRTETVAASTASSAGMTPTRRPRTRRRRRNQPPRSSQSKRSRSPCAHCENVTSMRGRVDGEQSDLPGKRDEEKRLHRRMSCWCYVDSRCSSDNASSNSC